VISIRIHFHGAIDRKGLSQDYVQRCDGPLTIEAFLESLGYASQQRKIVVPMLGGERRPLGHVLQDGDRLDVMAPAGGG
jgi:sulfur carrier protein ThiS